MYVVYHLGSQRPIAAPSRTASLEKAKARAEVYYAENGGAIAVKDCSISKCVYSVSKAGRFEGVSATPVNL